MDDNTEINKLLVKATAVFTENFPNQKPSVAGVAPGRVNLIGEHTDYNEGLVFPMALPLFTVVVGGKAEGDVCTLITTAPEADDPKTTTFAPPTAARPLLPGAASKWANYFKGVVANFHDTVPAFNAVIVTCVPLGGGLSSSASLEVATYTFLEALTGSPAESGRSVALACQKAEHEFCGVPCGIMDQYVAKMAQIGRALLIDCRSLECEPVKLADPSVCFLICDTNVRHQLAGSEYPLRRANCEKAADALGLKSLRDADMKMLDANKSRLSPVVYNRARHVITEIQRVKDAVKALKKSDFVQFGQLMTESHRSLRDDFEVSCAELDEVVEIALKVEGVKGARMTGGGFGGCAVILVLRHNLQSLHKQISSSYSGKATCYVGTPAKGAFHEKYDV